MDYKEEIIKKRQGGLGSSDALMIERIALRGSLSEGDRQRVAELLGMIERKQFSTTATRLGDEIEMGIYEIIKQKYPQAKSNPYYKSERLSQQYGFYISNHIDYEIETEEELIWVENKATKNDVAKTLETYKSQFNWHYMLLKEKSVAKHKKPRLFLSHYQTNQSECFDANFLTLTEFHDGSDVLIKKGLEVLQREIKGFVYSPRDELFVEYLPDTMQEEISLMGNYISQINEMNEKLDEFKKKMADLMLSANVKSIKNEHFVITFVPESKMASFDKKEFGRKHPELLEQFTKQVNKKAYVKITTPN